MRLQEHVGIMGDGCGVDRMGSLKTRSSVPSVLQRHRTFIFIQSTHNAHPIDSASIVSSNYGLRRAFAFAALLYLNTISGYTWSFYNETW